MTTNADDLPAYAPMDDPVFPEEDTPRTFMQLRQQIDQLGQDLENDLISVNEYDERRTDLDIVCGQLVSGNEALLDAAPDMLASLKECITDDAACCRVASPGYLIRRLEYINRVARQAIAKAKGGTP